MRATPLYQWLTQNPQGQALLNQEKAFFQAALDVQKNDFVLSIDSPVFQFSTKQSFHFIQQNQYDKQNIVAIACQTPWRENQFNTLISCHGLDQSDTLIETLTEWRRICAEQGTLLLTLFNPYAFWWLKRNQLPFAKALRYSPKNIIDTAQSIGWQLEHCHFLNYRPEWSNTSWQHKFFATVLPQSAIVYGFIFRKQTIGLPKPKFEINPLLFQSLNLNIATRTTSYPFSGSLKDTL